MSQISILIISGHVYSFDSSTPIEDVSVEVTNVRLNERHESNDVKFSELSTNAQGEFQCNLANFNTTWIDGDVIRIKVNHNGLKDVVEVTLDGSNVLNVVLMPCSSSVYEFERGLDEIGSKVSLFSTGRTLDEDYGSIETSSKTEKEFGEDIYASIQIEEDEEVLEDEGEVEVGLATGYFKIRYGIEMDDIVVSGSDTWKVADKPVVHSFKNAKHHVEARLKRVIS